MIGCETMAGNFDGIKPPKDYEIRTVTVNRHCILLVKMLQQQHEENKQRLGDRWKGDDWVFTQWNGEIMNPQTPTKQFRHFLKKHGLKHRKLHSLRHTSATLLLYGGVNIRQVQASNVIIKATNNGNIAAQFLESEALFFDANNNIISADSTYITDGDYELKPGATLTEQITTYMSFDHVEVYYTARG